MRRRSAAQQQEKNKHLRSRIECTKEHLHRRPPGFRPPCAQSTSSTAHASLALCRCPIPGSTYGPCASSNVSEPLLFPVAEQHGRKRLLSLTSSAQASLRHRGLHWLVSPLTRHLATSQTPARHFQRPAFLRAVSSAVLPCSRHPQDRFTTPRIDSLVNNRTAGRPSIVFLVATVCPT